MFPPSVRADSCERGTSESLSRRLRGRSHSAWKFHFHNLHDGSLSPDVPRGYIPLAPSRPMAEECALDGGEFLSRYPAARHPVQLQTNARIVLTNNFPGSSDPVRETRNAQLARLISDKEDSQPCTTVTSQAEGIITISN